MNKVILFGLLLASLLFAGCCCCGSDFGNISCITECAQQVATCVEDCHDYCGNDEACLDDCSEQCSYYGEQCMENCQ